VKIRKRFIFVQVVKTNLKNRERNKMNTLLAKQGLTAEQLTMVQAEVNRKGKSKGIAFALWWFTGVFGGHRFYAGDIGIGVGMLLTFGGLGIWSLIDVFMIGGVIEKKNEVVEMDAITFVKAMEQQKQA
jgi:TM2 domain-containing membrane protein YozV